MDEHVIETISVAIDVDQCQQICFQYVNCKAFQHNAANCTLFSEDYMQNCNTAGGPMVMTKDTI